MIRYAQGDIFDTPADIRVNTVNCVGVMGAGVALAFKNRYPEMFKKYAKACKAGEVRPGKPHVWEKNEFDESVTVVNLPTKDHWRQPSEYEYIEMGLRWLHEFVEKRGKVCVALPALGCGHGGLDWSRVQAMIEVALGDLPAEIIVFEPSSSHAAGERLDVSTFARLDELGIKRLRSGDLGYPEALRGRSGATVYLMGNVKALSGPMVAVIPSIKPSEREIQGVVACVRELANPRVRILTGYSAKADRPVIRAALQQGAHVIICLVEGILLFNIRRELQDVWDEGRVTVISASKPQQKWYPGGVGKATAIKLSLADLALISDPSPKWLSRFVRNGTVGVRSKIFYLDYGGMQDDVKASLRKLQAKPLSRSRESGKPNVAEVLAALAPAEPQQETSESIPIADVPKDDNQEPVPLEKAERETSLIYPKRLIEVDLPIKRISAHARREKDMRKGHIPNLLIYPASRPTAACRAVACAALWPDPGDKICPPRFVETAKRLMEYWGHECLRKCSSDSYPRFNKVAKKPECLENATELRKALLDVIADFANWDNSIDPDYLAVTQTLTVAAHDAQEGLDAFSLPKTISVKTLNEAIKDAPRPLLVDPFAGGGAIPLEGLRCGADAFASDLNPIALLLNKVATKYIPKHGDQLITEIEKWGVWARNKATSFLGDCYPSDKDGAVPIAYLWARTILCEGPGCGAKIPLLRSLMLARKGKNQVGMQFSVQPNSSSWSLRIVKKESGSWRFQDSGELVSPSPTFAGTVKNGSATCPCCGYTTRISSVVNQLSDRRGGSKDSLLFVVVIGNPGTRGRSFRLPNAEDMDCVMKSETLLHQLVSEQITRDKCIYVEPHEMLPPAGALGFRVQRYGMTEWQDLFNNRQLLSLLFYAQLVREYVTEVVEEDIQEAVNACLSLIICRMADLNTALCVWQLNTPNTAHLFGRWALSMAWDYGEINPLAQAGGSPESALRRMIRIIAYINEGISREGTTEFASAYSHPLPDDCANVFFTDPPYYDAIPYSDLMDFFYVWMKRTLCGNLTQLIEDDLCPKEDECIVDETKGKNRDYYEHGMFRAMIEGRRVLSPGGVGVVVFAHKSTSGWEAQLDSMVRAGWRITASWPIDTEMGSRLRAKDSAALASSVHLVCRPREDKDGNIIEQIGDWRDVLSELPGRIADWLPRLASEGVVGADAIFACLGPALEIFSRYSSVEKASGEVVPLREYLEQVWAEVARQALKMIFEDADASGFEEDARLTAMWLWTLRTDANGNGADDGKATSLPGYTLEYDAARKIAQGLGCHLENLTHLVEVKGDKAMLLSAESRARYLFGKKEVGATAKGRKIGNGPVQQNLFSLLGVPGEEETAVERAELDRPQAGKTALDQLHQAMLLFTAGRGAALKRFLVDDGIGATPQFWTLAQALSALYPSHTNEKRWVDGVLARKKTLGF